MALFERKESRYPYYLEMFSKFTDDFFEDDISKEIFNDRHNWNMTGERKNFWDKTITLLHNEFNLTLVDLLKNQNNKPIIMYGCGASAYEVYDLLTYLGKEISYYYVDDEYNRPENFCNLTFIEWSDISKEVDKYTFIVAANLETVYTTMKDKLISIGVSKDSIIDLNIDLGQQYFDLKELNLHQNEIFVDAGAFDGKTSIDFVNLVDSKYEKIILFEPDNNNILLCKDNLKNFNNIEYVNGGLHSESKTLYFNNAGLGSSRIMDEGTEQIKVYSLDEIVDEKGATFIKMDIEGAELDALKGCKETIIKHKPKLAISIYHNPEDIYDIPLYLKELVPEYKFYIRHYGIAMLETILYAII